MSRILIIYSTTDGHTVTICSRIRRVLEERGNSVAQVSVKQVTPKELESADKIVVGASIRYGKHSKFIYEFVNEFRQQLESKPNAFFSVNVVARKPEKSSPETNPYLKKFLRQVPWNPARLAVFAGRIDYQKYSVLDRSIIRFIMWITRGPTDPHASVEFTDWSKVDEFGCVIHEMKQGSGAA